MSVPSPKLLAALKSGAPMIAVTVSEALGSTPRDVDAAMYVTAEATFDTIGGGQLEYIAISHARRLIAGLDAASALSVPLGPDIGQCCGGHVEIAFERLREDQRHALTDRATTAARAAPEIMIFGAGHVGRALATVLAAMPYRTLIADTRSDTLRDLPPQVSCEAAPLPEALVRAASPGTAFVVLTHDHALDFLLMCEILDRNDALYAGMIGSKSKRARFASWYRTEGGTNAKLRALTSPIGATGLGDKRPEIIALHTATEISKKIGQHDCPTPQFDAMLSNPDRVRT